MDDPGDDTDDPFWKNYHSSMCSLPDRMNKPMVISVREIYSERQWAGHPMHMEAIPDVHDEVMAASPWGPGVNLRLMVARTEGQPFSDLDRLLLRLLQPHLQPLFRRTMRSVVFRWSPH